MHLRVLCQQRRRITGHADDGYVLGLYQRQETQQLFRRSGIRDGEYQVVLGQHTKVAVVGVQRIQEERRCTRRSQCSGYLRADMTGLTDAGYHYFAFAVTDQLHRLHEMLVQTRYQRLDSRRFTLQAFHCPFDDGLCLHIYLF